jgi:serine/threonine-protein kinase
MTPERWRRVDELFHSALEREPAQRAAFVREACAGDEALQREIEKLIAAHEKDGSFIDSPAYADTELLIDDQAVLIAGQRLGSYKVVTHIGSGGMGEVYLAEDIRLGRKVALKLLRAEFTANKERLRRFQQEARAASSLNHPNILTIHEIGQNDSLHFMATEYVEGETLRQRLTGAGMQLGEALDVSVQVASALAAAHEAGIVHRDIKPENIMVRRDGYAKVLDFGLAKLIQPKAADTGAATLPKVETQPGIVMGTVSYMSPEQARGLTVDARTDIFSLGVMLYEMVGGRAPFEGETPSDVLVSLLDKEPVPLSSYSPGVPTQLQRIVGKSLHKEREERYQVIKDLLIDLKSLRDELAFAAKLERSVPPDVSSGAVASGTGGQTVRTDRVGAAHPTSSTEYLISGIKQHKRGAALVLAALAVAVAAATYFYSLRGGGATINSMAVLPFVNAGADPDTEYLSDGITESLINSLSQLPNLRMIARTSAQRYKGRETDPQTVARELGVEAVLTGRVVRRGDSLSISAELVDARDNSHIWGEQYNRRISDVLVVQQEILREIAEKLRGPLTGEERRRVTRNYTENVEAYRLYSLGRYYWNKRTSDGFKKAIQNFEQAIAIDPDYALAYAGLGDSYILMGYFGALPMKEAMPKAKQAATRALEIDASIADAHASLANIAAWYEWDTAASEREFRKAIEINPNYPTAHHWYGLFLAATRRFDEAVQELKTAQSLDPTSLIINSDLGYTYYLARRYDDAIEQCSRTLEMDGNFELAHYEAGLAYVEKGNYDQALAEFGNATSLDNKPQALAMIGYTYARAGKRREAERTLAELETLARQRFIPPNEMAIINAALGDNDKALSFLEKDYELRSSNVFEIGVDPRMDSLRSDPRFRALLLRIVPGR